MPMSKKDKIQNQIDYMKSIVLVLITALFAIIGWLATIRARAELLDFILAGVGVVILGASLFVLNRLIQSKFKEIDKE